MWVFLSARLRTWLLLAIALPVARLLVHRLAVAAERHDPSARTAKLLHGADSAVTAVSGRSLAQSKKLRPARNRQMAELSPSRRAGWGHHRCVALSPAHLATSSIAASTSAAPTS